MGTYGVTHVKKDEKIIPFSDSYDGYWSGMGQSNILGLKYVPLSKLRQLFDSFSARKALNQEGIKSFEQNSEEDDDDEITLSDRTIRNFISQISQDNSQLTEAIDWATQISSGDIRTSAVGIVPLLYMNIHPHYGYDYEYCDYLVDLDKEQFVFNNIGLEIPLRLIQETSILNLRYFFETDLEFAKDRIVQDFPDFAGNLESLIYELKDQDKAIALIKLQEIVRFIFSLPSEPIQALFDENEKKRQEYLAQYNQDKSQTLPNDVQESDKDSYSYSIYSAQTSADKLRKIIYFLQEKSKQPGFEFILDCAEWGVEENYISGGVRLLSPQGLQKEENFRGIINTLEYAFKLRFNIMSGAGFGTGLFPDEHTPDLTIQKSIFSFIELEKTLSEEDFNIVKKEGLPYLAYHTYIEEASAYIVSQNGHTNSPVFWVFIALLTQNKELFDSVYSRSKNQLASLASKDSLRVKNLYLSSYYDGEQIVKLLDKNSKFIIDLMTTTFFEDCSEVLTEIEAKEFLC